MVSPRVAVVALLALLGAGAAALSAPAVPPTDPRPKPLVEGAAVRPAPTPVDVTGENRLPGAKDWRIPSVRARARGLAAYATAVSVRPGQSVPLVVSGSGPVTLRAYRMGWYGGDRARLVWRGTLQAHLQGADPGAWQASGWADTTGWPEGHYLIRLDALDASRYVPLTVRSATAKGRVLVLSSPLTWAAADAGPGPATLDRPYTRGAGAGGFLADDAGVVDFAERAGGRLAYATDDDLATHPRLLAGVAAVVTGSDSRFWTPAARAAVSRAAAAGANLAFFGAGTASRTVEVDGRALTVTRKVSTSTTLTGLRPGCPSGSPAADWRVADPGWWGYRGTEVEAGTEVEGLAGDGADRTPDPGASSGGSAVQVLADGAVRCGDVFTTQNAVYATRPSGAGVFTAGTGRWACTLTGACAANDESRDFARTVTQNVVKAFAAPRAGRRHPVRS